MNLGAIRCRRTHAGMPRCIGGGRSDPQIQWRSAPLHLGVRIGLHAGLVFLGNMGAGGRFAFRVMGDIVNTASRIEGLNKYLGTRLLATEEVVAGVDGLLLRPLGDFRLKGKQGVASVFEIMALRDGASRERRRFAAVRGRDGGFVRSAGIRPASS